MNALVPERDFPFTEEVAYFNSASMGLVSQPVIARHAELAGELGRFGTRAYFDHEQLITKAPREAGARLFGCEPESIGLCTSVSEAVSQIAWWLRPDAESNVVSLDIEEPAVTYPWIRAAEDSGFEVRLADARREPAALSLDQLAALVDDRTAAVCVSHVQWITGHRFDLAALAELAHAHGALLVVDAFQSAGVVPIDVIANDVDVLITGAYKWLCAFSGVALCYVRSEIAEQIHPVLAGSMSANPKPPYDNFDATRLEFAGGARSLEYGNASHAARMAFAPAVDYLMNVGIERIQRHTLGLTAQLARGIERLGGEVVTPREDAARAGITTARFPGHDAVALVAELREHGVLALPRMGYVRFAAHAYNRESDVDRALAALATVVDGR